MAQPAVTRDVLTTLDERQPTSFYWQLTLLATLAAMNRFRRETWKRHC
jgi:hypothetical protein